MGHFFVSLWCALLLLSLGGAAAVTIVNGTLGRSVLVSPTYEVPADCLIQWNFNSVTVAQYSASLSQCFGQLYGRCQVYLNGSLTIDNITYADEGVYSLTTQSLTYASSPNNTDYQIRVYAILTAPDLSFFGTSGPVISGSFVLLQCNAGIQAVSTYTYYRDERPFCSPMSPQSNVICGGSNLVFITISTYDSGSYTCTIQNPVSSNTSDSLIVTVIAPVSNVMVTSNVSGLVWPGIDSVSLRCSALGTNVSYSWSLQGATISTGTRFQLSADNSTLFISPVTTSDNGSFICTVKNVINNQSSEVKFNLASPVSTVTLTGNTSGDLWAGQDSVSLYCTAQGSAITFSWRLNGEPLSLDPPYYITQSNSTPKSTLIISPISKNDNGPFTCTASNRANNETSNTTSFNINWFPDRNILCTAQPVNQTIQLGCSWPGGKPAANVTLIFNGTENTRTDQVIRNVTSRDIHGNNLTCNGDQLGRTSSCVLLFEPPNSSDHVNSSRTSSTDGGTVILTVNLRSETQSGAGSSSFQVLPAQFSWFGGADNSSIQTGGNFSVDSSDYVSTLKIYEVSASDSGTYYCIARNFIGNTTFLFNVVVKKNAVGSGNGLNGGQIAGIVIGALAGVSIIGIIVFLILRKGKTPETVYDDAHSPPINTYETILPGTLNEPIYHTVMPGPGI